MTAPQKVVVTKCPTVCDDDCSEVWCHEEHIPFWKREHTPENCPGRPA